MRWKRLFLTSLGAFLAAFGLEMFLTPNQIILGGVKGLSGILSHVTEMHMGLFLFFLNLPFVLAGAGSTKRSKLFLSLFALLLLSVLTILLHPFPPLVESPPLASFFGGLILGTGVGLIFRYSGLSDGVDRLAVMIRKRGSLSVAEVVMLVNIAILALGGLVFGWRQAVYSIFAYTVAFKSTEYTLHFLLDRAVWIKSERSLQIDQALRETLVEDYRRLTAARGGSRNELFLVTKRRQVEKVLQTAYGIDPQAAIHVTPFSADQEGYLKL